jgi:hypothetical protein
MVLDNLNRERYRAELVPLEKDGCPFYKETSWIKIGPALVSVSFS